MRSIIFVIILAISGYISLQGFNEKSSPSILAKKFLSDKVDFCASECENLIIHIKNKEDQKCIESYKELRKHFKQIDFLIAYIDPMMYDKTLNESPLHKAEYKVANKSTHIPSGFQMLDETLFADVINYEDALKHSTIILRTFNEFKRNIQVLYLYDSMIFQSIKEGLVRSFTLGVTGFDTPSSGLAMDDLRNFQIGLKQLLIPYQENQKITRTVSDLINVIDRIPFESFDNFNRYQYLVQTINPASSKIEELRSIIQFEKPEEITRMNGFYNSVFTNLFQKDFLDSYAYLGITSSDKDKRKSELGKLLFNDKKLSYNESTSCASCHNENLAFTDQKTKSISSNGRDTLLRNSPSINYSVYSDKYFHDLRALDLNNQFEHVIFNELEFNTNYKDIISKLEADEKYMKEFKELYPNLGISRESIFQSLKLYISTLPTFDSEFDKYAQSNQLEIPKNIENGFNIFMGKGACGTCHFAPVFSGIVPPKFEESESEVLGVGKDNNFEKFQLDEDHGRFVNGIIKDTYKFYDYSFKTPSIRNVQYSFPYMHNGSLKSLVEVLIFYNKGGGAGLGIDLNNQTLPFDSLSLSESEIQDIISFLNALTDNYLNNSNETKY